MPIAAPAGHADAPPTLDGSGCVLCDITVHRDYQELATTISAYVADNITRTQTRKIAQDVLDVLQQKLPPGMLAGLSVDQVVAHIQTHTTNPTIIMTQIVRDLTELAGIARDSCCFTCEETSRKIIDSKAANIYLKTVGELQTALRHEALRPSKA